jgi:hypothetical protein
MAWREIFDRQSGRLIGVAFDDCSLTQQARALCHFKSGIELEANLKVVEHPEGRFLRADGTRVDVFVLDLLKDCEILPPSISSRDPRDCQRECLEKKAGARFVGECRDQIMGGNCVRITSTKAA